MEQRLIDANALIEYLKKMWGKWDEDDWYEAKAKDATKDDIDVVNKQPTVDAVPVVRCRECKYRFVNEHYGKKGYFDLKAYCKLDTGDIFELGRHAEDDDWFCADGERISDGE